MAKNNNKGKDSAIPNGGVALNDSNTGGDSLPNFEENAFAGLRQKIEQKLKDQNSKSKNKGKGGAKDALKDDIPKKDAPTPKKDNNNKKETAPKPAPKQEPKNDNKGKKRDRSGDVIMREEKPAGKDKASKSNDDDTLRQEILALGGTEEDLDLIAGAESEDEVEDANISRKSGKSDDDALRKELSGMLAAAGQVVPEDLKDDEVEEEEEEADDDEEEDGDGDDESDEQEQAEEEESDAEVETSPEPLKETRKEPTKSDEFVVPKEFASLVCILTQTQLLGEVETNRKLGYSSKI